MPLVPARCPMCNGTIEVDPYRETAVCKFCDTPFITEKAINNYNTTYHIKIDTLHAAAVHINDDSSRDNRVKSGETHIRFNDYASAEKVFREMTEKFPYDYRGWWGLIKVYSRNFTDFNIDRSEFYNIRNLYSKAYEMAEPNEKALIEAKYREYSTRLEQKLNERLNDARQRMQRESYEYESRKKALESRINALYEQQKGLKQPSKILAIVLAIGVLLIAIDLFSNALHIGGNTSEIVFAISPYVIGIGLIALAIKHAAGKALDTSYYKKVNQLETEISSLRTELRSLSDANTARARDYDETLAKIGGR